MGRQRSDEERLIINARQSGVNAAWSRERTLVLMGRGTRDWSAEEQKELIETGRIQGYEGHHMSSVKSDPDNAANVDNIQILTHEEHLAAHNGNYKNPTNGCYDPKTGTTAEFTNGRILPVEEMDLSDPLFEHIDLEALMQEIEDEEYSEELNVGMEESKMDSYSGKEEGASANPNEGKTEEGNADGIGQGNGNKGSGDSVGQNDGSGNDEENGGGNDGRGNDEGDGMEM